MSRAIRRAAVMILATASIAGAQSTDQTLDRAITAWGKVKTARATFEQTVTNSLTGSSATARGEYQQQRPNRVAIRFTDPAGDRIVADGASVWVYLPSSAPGQVVKRSASDGTALVDRWPLVYAPSSQILDEIRREPAFKRPADIKALIVGNPTRPVVAADEELFRGSRVRSTFEPLPGAEEEAKTISALLPASQPAAFHAPAFSPDGGRVALGSNDGIRLVPWRALMKG